MAGSIRRRSVAKDTHITDTRRSKKHKTLHYTELAPWQKDNEYIVHGYRQVQNHWRGCLTSVYAYLHNETVNIHSHLWGAALFIYFLANFNSVHRSGTTWVDSAVFTVFLLSAVFCLSASSFYHTMSCHSEKVSSTCHAFDYSGIVVLIVGSFYPFLHYGFHCQAHLQLFYILTITLAGLGALYIVLNPEYAKATHRGARTAVFIGLGLCAIVPVSHLLVLHGSRHLIAEMGVGWLLISGALYIIGALLYANRIPERLAPGRFDFFFASHQIFHFFIVFAALAHYHGALKALDYRLSRPFC
ncbi:ADIPOR-like receptor SPBC12C2.09c [Hypsizygus marmoreus]|uniref:ADIPOR-like receptor SPBC12C2.09c n=1 Tax=Hypsizygus marmoreus TaxID=39966 RepID=A0A369KD94_HYPMA|nr:ADIPOR-like receptor SPBC12C2.09c [Hypsizygus marmoreus]